MRSQKLRIGLITNRPELSQLVVLNNNNSCWNKSRANLTIKCMIWKKLYWVVFYQFNTNGWLVELFKGQISASWQYFSCSHRCKHRIPNWMEIVLTMEKKLCTPVPLLDNAYTVDFTIIISLYLLWINTFFRMNTSLVRSTPTLSVKVIKIVG